MLNTASDHDGRRRPLFRQQFPRELGAAASEVWKKAMADEVFGRAAQLAFFWFFSLFPFLIFLTALASLLRQEGRLGLIITASGHFLPPEASALLVTTFNQVNSRGHRGLLSFSLLALIWAASAGMESVVISLNRAYNSDVLRPWWKEKLVALILTVGFGVFFLAAIILLNFSEQISHQIAIRLELGEIFIRLWAFIKWPLITILALVGIELVYFFAPSGSQRWQLFTPGTLFALSLWLLISFVFRLYVRMFSSFDLTYGTLGGVMMLLLWLYLTGVAILVGGEINSTRRRDGNGRPDHRDA